MLKLAVLGTLVLLVNTGCLADVSHIFTDNGNHPYQTETTTYPSPPVPYSFHYKAGRYPGTIDRFQSESGDGYGTVKGTYSYIDPKFQIRTVDYTADQNGFHPVLKNYEEFQVQPQDTEAVQLAKTKHFEDYNRIALANSQLAVPGAPRDTVSVANAKHRHFELFRKIAAEHEAIAAQRAAERHAFEATSVPNDVEQHVQY